MMDNERPKFETPGLNHDAREAAAGLSAYVEEWTSVLNAAEPPDETGPVKEPPRAPSRIPDGVVLALLAAVVFLALATSAFPTLPPP